MTKFLFQGHASYRFITDEGKVLYVDPFAGEGYDLAADLILVTHQHQDHNQVQLVTHKNETITITNENALINGKYQHFDLGWVKVTAVPAYNEHHNKSECVGYLLEMDGIKVYCSGDTGLIDEMSDLHDLQLNYAILNSDDTYTIPYKDVLEVTKRINAKHNIPAHLAPTNLFSQEAADRWPGLNKLIVHPGEEITLVKD